MGKKAALTFQKNGAIGWDRWGRGRTCRRRRRRSAPRPRCGASPTPPPPPTHNKVVGEKKGGGVNHQSTRKRSRLSNEANQKKHHGIVRTKKQIAGSTHCSPNPSNTSCSPGELNHPVHQTINLNGFCRVQWSLGPAAGQNTRNCSILVRWTSCLAGKSWASSVSSWGTARGHETQWSRG